jgi:hypothetical protein
MTMKAVRERKNQRPSEIHFNELIEKEKDDDAEKRLRLKGNS